MAYQPRYIFLKPGSRRTFSFQIGIFSKIKIFSSNEIKIKRVSLIANSGNGIFHVRYFELFLCCITGS